ncbi:MAG: flavodoxin-dependent (E)-4-hydroxy-3-methylbut-2-enyl-diphosphate synthase, partial [Clostridia bacterium]|nr:flavodoxin-dependent (E)-4-hydroxy-3-methylbut-2-enyl-diphosphate synthase [Clostridia bacterium]
MTKKMQCGNITIGGGAAISVQSMTNTDTCDTESTLAQIRALYASGADIVRVSVYNQACTGVIRALVDNSPVPLIADVHFDHTLAVQAAERGVAKLRVNPGNIGGQQNVARVAHAARSHHIPIRIGVNSG